MANKKVMKLASRGKRFGAACIDMGVPTVLYFFLMGILAANGIYMNYYNGYNYNYNYNYNYGSTAATPIFALIISLLTIAFFIVELVFYAKGQSIGKAILGMQVISSIDGKPFRFWKMMLRECIVKGCCGSVFFLGYIWILIDDKNRGWHDKILDSYVVDLKESAAINAGMDRSASVRSAYGARPPAQSPYAAPAPGRQPSQQPYAAPAPTPAPAPGNQPSQQPYAAPAPGRQPSQQPYAAPAPAPAPAPGRQPAQQPYAAPAPAPAPAPGRQPAQQPYAAPAPAPAPAPGNQPVQQPYAAPAPAPAPVSEPAPETLAGPELPLPFTEDEPTVIISEQPAFDDEPTVIGSEIAAFDSEPTVIEAEPEEPVFEIEAEIAEPKAPEVSMAMKKDELLAVAEQLGVKVGSKATKADIIEAINKVKED